MHAISYGFYHYRVLEDYRHVACERCWCLKGCQSLWLSATLSNLLSLQLPLNKIGNAHIVCICYMCLLVCVCVEGSTVLKKARVWCVRDEDTVRSVDHREVADLALRHSRLCFWQENSLVCAQILVRCDFFPQRSPFAILNFSD